MAWPPLRSVRRLDRLVLRFREQAARRLWPTPARGVALQPAEGRTLPARLHLPVHPGPHPAVLLVPGGLDGARSTESPSCVLPAQRLARAGIAAMVFTPSGREGSPGAEDANGPVHQTECAAALSALLAQPQVDPARVAVLSLSFGLVMALGALAGRADLEARVRLLVDWEGPGSRRWFAATTIGAEPDDDGFWHPREGVRLVRELSVPYRRFQSRWDHVHGPDTGIGWEMAHAAQAAGCPSVRLNQHRAPLPAQDRVVWGPGLRSRQGAILLRWLLEGVGDPNRKSAR